jgi:hypothetical protein
MHFKSRRTLAAGAAVLSAAAFTGGAVAATGSSSTSPQAYENDVAKRLNVSPQQLNGAMQAAFLDRLNAAVAAGKLTQAQADRIKQRVQQDGARPWLLARAWHRHGHGARLTAAAQYLGLSRQQLVAQLRAGKSLAQIAPAQGKTVAGLNAAMLVAAKARLDTAVARGRITAAQEQQMLAKLPTRLDRLINRTGLPTPGIHARRG